MERIAGSLCDLVGRTPLLALSRYGEGAKGHLVGKLEQLNPNASHKDRIALAMIETAEASGALEPGGTIVEPTSGNTGVALAWVAAAKGYKVVLTMPERSSEEQRRMLEAFGAKIVFTPWAEGMRGAIEEAHRLCEELDAFLPQQFQNQANMRVHYEKTAPEIWEDTGGELGVFVAGIGTGGTISGVGTFLKEKAAGIHVVGVEPSASAVISGGEPGPHVLRGLGAGFVPSLYNPDVVDEILTVSNQEAVEASRTLARTEGLLLGASSGAVAHAGLQLARQERFAGKRIVLMFCDTGERYLNTPLFASSMEALIAKP